MLKYRKKPVVIEAWQWNGEPARDWPGYVATYIIEPDRRVLHHGTVEQLTIPTLEGEHIASKGDWITVALGLAVAALLILPEIVIFDLRLSLSGEG